MNAMSAPIQVELVTEFSQHAIPSPRPSPQRRGRIVSSVWAKIWLTSARLHPNFKKMSNGCSLSPGERVRMRGNGTTITKRGKQ